MPNIKSAIKRVKTTERNRVKNRTWRTSVRTAKTDVISVLGKPAEQQKALNEAYKTIDMAVSKGIIHKNAAARRKSRLAQLVNSAKKNKTK